MELEGIREGFIEMAPKAQWNSNREVTFQASVKERQMPRGRLTEMPKEL